MKSVITNFVNVFCIFPNLLNRTFGLLTNVTGFSEGTDVLKIKPARFSLT